MRPAKRTPRTGTARRLWRRGTGDAPGRLRREGRRSRTLCEAHAGRGPNFPAPSRASHPCRGASLRRSVAFASPPARLRRSVGRAASGPLADNRGYRPRSGGSPAALRCAGAPLPPPGPACGRTFDITSERYVKPPGASGARSIARSLKGLATSLANAPPHAPLVLARCAPRPGVGASERRARPPSSGGVGCADAALKALALRARRPGRGPLRSSLRCGARAPRPERPRASAPGTAGSG